MLKDRLLTIREKMLKYHLDLVDNHVGCGTSLLESLIYFQKQQQELQELEKTLTEIHCNEENEINVDA